MPSHHQHQRVRTPPSQQRKHPSTCANSRPDPPPILWEVAQHEHWLTCELLEKRFPTESALLSANAHGLDGQLCTPPLWDKRSCCFPGKWLSLPVWLNYRCFERLKQIIKTSRAIKTIKHKKSLVVLQLRREETLLLFWVSGEKRSTAQRQNPNKSRFLGELTSCFHPAFQISLFLSSFTGLLAEAHHLYVVFPTEEKRLLSQGLRRPVWHVTLRAKQAAYKTGREPSRLSVTLQPIYTNRPNLLVFFQPHSAFIFFFCFHHLYVTNDWDQREK